MIFKIVFKDFKSNFKENVHYFIANGIGVAELFVFLGMNSVIEEIMINALTGDSVLYDSTISLGSIVIFSIALMVYSMLKYIKIRIRNYSLFVIIGMKKYVMFTMMAFEYFIGCSFSMLIGLLAGTGILHGVLRIEHILFPEYIGVAEIDVSVYGTVCKINLGIMVAVFFLLLIWADNTDLSSLTIGDEAKEKRPRRVYWIVMVFIGIILLIIGFFEYSASEVRGWPFINAHMEWIAGGFLIIAFGGGIILEKLRQWGNIYINNILKLNRMYSKYQSNLLVLLMLFAVHFLALSYCIAGIVEILPLKQHEKNYPYDAIWMAQERKKDKNFSTELVEKYNGTVQYIPMIRVTNYFDSEQIGISKSVYEKITGIDCELEGREIICGISESKCKSEKVITSDIYKELYEWLVPGKLTYELHESTNDPNGIMPSMDKKNLFQIKSVHTQNWFGKYGITSYCEDVIVFSDEYFEEQRGRFLKDPKESTMLEVFDFPKEQSKKACKDLEKYVSSYGVKDSEWTIQKQSSLYITEQTINELEKLDIFKITNKLFIMITLFMSGLLALTIKTVSEIPYFSKRYEFLTYMGIRKRMRNKTISIEIQCIPTVAVISAALLSGLYLHMHIIRESSRGVDLGGAIWLYWIMILFVYLITQYIAQKLLVINMNHILKKRVGL